MKLYGNLPEQKAIGTLIHDSNSAIGLMRNRISLMKRKEEISIRNADLLEENIKAFIKAIDNYILKFQKDFKTE